MGLNRFFDDVGGVFCDFGGDLLMVLGCFGSDFGVIWVRFFDVVGVFF